MTETLSQNSAKSPGGTSGRFDPRAVEQPVKTGELSREISALDSRCMHLREITMALQDRLEPVLRVLGPEVKGEAQPPTGTPHGNAVRGMHDHVSETCNILESILVRLEL